MCNVTLVVQLVYEYSNEECVGKNIGKRSRDSV